MHLAGLRVDPLDGARDENLRSESLRLLERTACELVAGHSGREAEIVLDPRRGARLSSGRMPFDHHDSEPLGRAVHRRSEPGGARADDEDVVVRVPWFGLEIEQLCDASEAWAHYYLS